MICPTENCGGDVARDSSDDWVMFQCERCGTEWAIHQSKVDPKFREHARLEQAGIPDCFIGRTFNRDDHNKSALHACRNWLHDVSTGQPLPSPALHGGPGRGKSHLLSRVCVLLICEHDKRVLFRSARQLLRELQDFDGAHETAWRTASTVDVLALDDLGAQQDTDWRSDQLADLIDERYQKELPTIVASNFPPRTWPDMFDARTASRLRGMTFSLELKGDDRRQLALTTPLKERV